jgi:CBS domain containing-hemolysin-like protein
MRKYTSHILVAAFLLSILLSVFGEQIIQRDAITTGTGILVCLAALLTLFYMLYSAVRMRRDGEPIDWNKPNIFMRAFFLPTDSQHPID